MGQLNGTPEGVPLQNYSQRETRAGEALGGTTKVVP
jgi:hypothetical protein